MMILNILKDFEYPQRNQFNFILHQNAQSFPLKPVHV